MTLTVRFGRCPCETRRAGYTLIELIVSLGAGSLLLAGLASAIAVSAQGWSPELSPRQQADASAATRRIHDDIQFALQFTERTSQSTTFTVPDRDGDGAKETIRYVWSGTAGDPLTVSVNGQAPEALIEDVQAFQFDWQTRTVIVPFIEPTPAVLFLSAGVGPPDEVQLTTQEQFKVAYLQSVNEVHTASVFSNQAELQDLVDQSTVIFVSGEVSLADFPAWIAQATVGIVSERAELCQLLGLCNRFTAKSFYKSTEFYPAHRFHDVIGEAGSEVKLASSRQRVQTLEPPFSRDLRVLALRTTDSRLEVVMGAVEEGAESSNRAFTVPARRVILPTGGPGTDFRRFDSEYLTIIDNAMRWASGLGEDAPLDLNVVLVGFTAPGTAGIDRDRLYLMQNLGCRVVAISPRATEAELDAALNEADLVWIRSSFIEGASANLLNAKPVGVIIENRDWLAHMGFGAEHETANSDKFIIPTLSHPVLSGFAPGDLRVSWTPRLQTASTGFPDAMQLLAARGGSGSSTAMLGVFEAGADTHIGPAPARRIWFSYSQYSCITTTEEMQRLAINVVKWAGGSGTGQP